LLVSKINHGGTRLVLSRRVMPAVFAGEPASLPMVSEILQHNTHLKTSSLEPSAENKARFGPAAHPSSVCRGSVYLTADFQKIQHSYSWIIRDNFQTNQYGRKAVWPGRCPDVVRQALSPPMEVLSRSNMSLTKFQNTNTPIPPVSPRFSYPKPNI
jgi:hypothetical protein